MHASFCQSETSEVTIERETTVWLMDEAKRHPKRYGKSYIQYKVRVLFSRKQETAAHPKCWLVRVAGTKSPAVVAIERPRGSGCDSKGPRRHVFAPWRTRSPACPGRCGENCSRLGSCCAEWNIFGITFPVFPWGIIKVVYRTGIIACELSRG